ncbi:MAG: hypothetical protein ACK4SY_06715 [Pyrobaculum sp.]
MNSPIFAALLLIVVVITIALFGDFFVHIERTFYGLLSGVLGTLGQTSGGVIQSSWQPPEYNVESQRHVIYGMLSLLVITAGIGIGILITSALQGDE